MDPGESDVDAGEASAPSPASVPWQMTVAEATVQRRGSSPASRVVLVGDGRSLVVTHRPDPDEISDEVTVLVEIEPRNFDVCPICLAPEPDSADHVPPQSLGGRRMTLLCGPCNNILGTRLESDFLDWRDDAIWVWASSDAVRGPRNIRRVLRRRAESGGFALVASDTRDGDLHEMFSGGGAAFECTVPSQRNVGLAGLKSAYLAACLNLRQIPESPWADAVRAELLAARDALDRHSIPPSPIAESLTMARSYRGPQGPSLALASVGDARHVAVWLAGTVVAPWPLPDVLPRL